MNVDFGFGNPFFLFGVPSVTLGMLVFDFWYIGDGMKERKKLTPHVMSSLKLSDYTHP